MMKSTLYLIDTEDQLSKMKLAETEDAKTHLSELQKHFETMVQRRDNLIKMGSSLTDTRFNTLIMSSLPESYRPTLQTITAAERASRLSGQSQQMKSDDLISFIIEEAQHQLINDECTKLAETALAAHAKKTGKGKNGKPKESKMEKSGIQCENCKRDGHTKSDCWAKGGDKEGQGPRQKKKDKPETAIVASNDEDTHMFAFSCTSEFGMLAENLQLPKSRLGTCIDSGASQVYCPDQTKFSHYKTINRKITTADGRSIKAIGMGDLHVDLPNGSKRTNMMFKNAIHAPDMAFTLISISRLDKANYKVTFNRGMCTIIDPKGRTIATIPHSDGLYRITPSETSTSDHANIATSKMNINEAHRKLGHISSAAIKYAVSKGYITGIELDNDSKPEFCEACTKAKSATQPFPKESQTRTEKYGDRVHWDLWGPAAVKSLTGHFYVAARIDDATRETKLYFQTKKSETLRSYKRDEALILTQTGNQIKVVHSDRGGEFLSNEIKDHQKDRGTIHEWTVHDSPQQNGTAERGMRTRAERARALLIAAGLPRFLWEEAMRHTTWLQNRTPARAINGKTPYEMRNGKKPYLGGIQEFGTAAYVKDIKAGKLDARAQMG